MKGLLILPLMLLTVHLTSYCQLQTVKAPFRKTEHQIMTMVKGDLERQKLYSNEGMVLYFKYSDYNLYFTFKKAACVALTIISAKKDSNTLDQHVLKWLYENEFTTPKKENGSWEKIIPYKNISGESTHFPVYANKTDPYGWFIFDVIGYNSN